MLTTGDSASKSPSTVSTEVADERRGSSEKNGGCGSERGNQDDEHVANSKRELVQDGQKERRWNTTGDKGRRRCFLGKSTVWEKRNEAKHTKRDGRFNQSTYILIGIL